MSLVGTQFLIAKYVPDLMRNEPRNIGVIVWSDSGMAARFLGADKYGNFTTKNLPGFVESPPVYKQWINFWLSEIQKNETELIGSSKLVSRESPEFIDALLTTGKGSYFLDKGGAIFESISPEKLPKLIDELYSTLVCEKSDAAEEKENSSDFLEVQCETAIQKTKLSKNRFFKKQGMTVQCKIATSVTEKIQFSYAIGNGTPVWLGQKVPLRIVPSERQLVIDAWLLRFQAVVESGFVVGRDRLAAFVCPTDTQMRDQSVRDSLNALASRARVLNLNNEQESREALEEIAQITVEGH